MKTRQSPGREHPREKGGGALFPFSTSGPLCRPESPRARGRGPGNQDSKDGGGDRDSDGEDVHQSSPVGAVRTWEPCGSALNPNLQLEAMILAMPLPSTED